MVAGKLSRVDENHNPETQKEKLQQKLVEKALKVNKTPDGEKGDPNDFPPEFTYLMKELHNKGGIRFDNTPEFQQICKSLYDEKIDEKVKNDCFTLLEHIVNYANMWIIHYNRHKKD